jgi:hypothetical protein
MRLYEKYVPIMVHRLNIFEQGKPTIHLAFTGTSLGELSKYVLSLLPKKDRTDKKVVVQIRENIGGKNGKAKNVAVYGYSAEQIAQAAVIKLKLN